jgi:signal transduction histidine kinase
MFTAHDATLEELEERVSRTALAPIRLDALERSDREYELESILESWGMDNAWELAPALVKLDYRSDMLESLREEFGAENVPLILMWMSEIYEVQSLLTEIHAGSQRISEIVAAMKSYTFMDQAALLEIDLHEGLNNTLVILRNRLKSGITLHLDFADDIPPIQAYGSELNQVWTNIIDNAIDAMDGKGEITIRTRHEGDNVIVTIEDNGPGIPEAVLPTIFDPFVTTKAPGQGTGMGLYVSHTIVVQKHNGTLTCSSQPGKTVFTISLPINFEALQIEEQS